MHQFETPPSGGGAAARFKREGVLRWLAGVPELVKGAGLKLRCLVLRGFESHPLHHAAIRLLAWRMRELQNYKTTIGPAKGWETHSAVESMIQ